MAKKINSDHKKILALDGGGIKGALTLGLLKKFEENLIEIHGEGYRLRDYFDLMGGTSTGSIIASGLAIGLTVDELKEKYFQLGEKVFGKKNILRFIFGGGKFAAKKLKEELHNVFGDIKLDDSSIKDGALAIFAKRIDTQSLWVIYNNKEHKYWKYQKDYILKESIRASSAAPTYFRAEEIDVKGDGSQIGDFIDGGLSVANNPALNLFLLTTISNYGYNWSKGKENLSIYSFGTGKSVHANLPKGLIKPIGWAKKATSVLMDDVSEFNDVLLKILSHSNCPKRKVDSVLLEMDGVKITEEPLLNYYRYNVDFTKESLNRDLGFSFTEKQIKGIRKMDNPKYVKELYEIGYKAASQIEMSHIK